MNIYAPARRDETASGTPQANSHEIKYREDAAAYVAAMLAELRQIAGKAGFDKLVRSLDTAYYDTYGALDAKGREAAPAPRATAPGKKLKKTAAAMEPAGTVPR